MREILFRGKRTDNDEWVEGYYVCNITIKNTYHYIFPKNTCEGTIVIPETVGQYTGLTDKNGKKIFEGDIIVDNFFKLLPNKPHIAKFYESNRYGVKENLEFEIQGNIYDNPELLKENE